jgi:protein-disulfide isomerase
MKTFRAHAGLRSARTLGGVLLVLLILGALVAACTTPPAAPAAPAATAAPASNAAPTAAPAPTAATQPPAAAAAQAAPTEVKPGFDTSKLLVGVDAQGDFYRGDVNAPVKMVEYSDFQCPYCERFTTQTGTQLDQSVIAQGKVLHVFKNFPLVEIHPLAMPAAKVAYCAGQQKPAFFWAFHDWFFANQNSWSQQSAEAANATWRKQAETFGVDLAKFDTCLKDAATEAAIRKDMDEGGNAGVQGTPAFFINDWFLSGAQPLTEFTKTIDKAVQGQHPAPTATPLPAGVQPYDPDPNRPGRTYDGSPYVGDPQAPLVWIGFEDFKCQSCASWVKETEQQLIDKYVKDGKLRMVYKSYPTDAPNAAVASLCAADQGKFSEYRAALFAKQADWKDDAASLTGIAKDLGLDVAKFTKCLEDKPGQPQIDSDISIAEQVGVDRLPYFLLLNPKAQTGARVPGAVPMTDLEPRIQQLLNPPPTPASQPLATPSK